MRAFVPLLLAASVALAACSRPAPSPEPVRAVRTVTVGLSGAQPTQQFAAEVRARTESRLAFEVGGRLVERRVNLGEPVRAGQVLARLDADNLRLGSDAAQAALQAAQVQFAQAEADVQRFGALREQGFISDAQFSRYDTALKAAQAQLAQARAQAGVQANLARYAELRADAAGVVTAVEAEPGAVLAAGSPVLRVAHDGPRDVVFSVPEDQLDRLRAIAATPGALTVRLWGSDASPFPARVREVAAAADPLTRTFLVKADVGDAPVRLGQTATVTAALPRREGVVRLPLTALFERQGQTTVWVVDAATSTVQPRPVGVAGTEGNVALVASGLADGDVVVTAGVHVLTAGQKVTQHGASADAAGSRAAAPAPAGR
ncbi:efflux RND transporter periplasmic adaptor subunit [Azohydromonas sediminis]|uniref:efflux RND transporter periplasmic adaptor subunit n=1 Tax=Azohydromonas sediminis TaxID=2259674 RepID=UPI000E658122|nr:efflux RND transporter periplasmic adaptor subunit [Azohydromonas sediminis]